MDIDAMTGVERPSNRLLWTVVAILLPVIVVGGGAALFIHTYIAPITARNPEPTLLASYEPAVAAPPASIPAAEPESQPAPQPASSRPLPMMSGFNATSLWPNVAPAQPPAPDHASANPPFNPLNGSGDASEPIAGPIPLPQPRPRIASAPARGNVPLPRPRPGASEPE